MIDCSAVNKKYAILFVIPSEARNLTLAAVFIYITSEIEKRY